MRKIIRQLPFINLFFVALLLTACQHTASNSGPPPTDETVISQAATPSPTPTATPTSTATSLPTPTHSPTPTPIPTLPPPPTPTTIPADAPPPTVTNTPTPPPTAALLPSAVDLPTLNESLALLDRVERRKVEWPSRLLPYEIIIYADFYHIGDYRRKSFFHPNPQANPFIATFEVPYKGKVVNLSMTVVDVNPNEESTHVYLNNTWVAVLNQYGGGKVKIPIDPGLIKIGTNEIKIEGRIAPGYNDIDDVEFWDLKLIIN
jgi:hypothetical protein